MICAARRSVAHRDRFERSNSAATFAPADFPLTGEANRVVKIKPISTLTAIRLHFSRQVAIYSNNVGGH
jgi:hypothetical protein